MRSLALWTTLSLLGRGTHPAEPWEPNCEWLIWFCFSGFRYIAVAHEHHTVEEIDMGEPIDAILWIHVRKMAANDACRLKEPNPV